MIPRRLLVISVLFLSAAALVKYFPFQVDVPLQRPLAELPLSWKGWEGRSYGLSAQIEQLLGVTEYLSRVYTRERDRVEIYIGYYRSQRAEQQIHSPRHCLPGGGLVPVSERVVRRDIPGYGPIRFVEALYQRGDARETFVYWYRMRDSHITNEYLLKLSMIWNSLRYRRNEATFVRISSPVPPGEGDAMKTIDLFMEDFLPLLATTLPV